jgi:anthranilate phosphoribosyltransferase
MIVGVFSKDLGLLMAQSLQLLGVEQGWVVSGAIGLDEVNPINIDQSRRAYTCLGVC